TCTITACSSSWHCSELSRSRSQNPVEHVAPQLVMLGERRMIEVVGAGMRHPELFHDSARAPILRDGVGDDLGQLEPVEAKAKRGLCSFGSVALFPVRRRESPADLDAWREVSDESGQQTGESQKRTVGARLDDPEAEPMFCQMLSDTR